MKKEQLLSKIRKEFPKVTFKKAELVTSGWMNDVLILDNKTIFRFIKKQSDKKAFLREVKFLKDFSKISNIRVPEYTFLSKDGSFGGYGMIKGEALTPQLYKKFSMKEQWKIIKELVKFINILHTIPLSKFKDYGFKEHKSLWEHEMREQRAWFKKEFEKKVSDKLTAKESAYIRKFVTIYYQSKHSFKPVFIHNDLSHDHVLLNRDKTIAGIIDFGDIAIGDPASEFNGFFDYDLKMPRQIYKLYEGPKDKTFLERAEKRFMYRWIYLIYAGLVRVKDKGLYKEARERLQSFINKDEA